MLDENTIKQRILPYVSKGKRGVRQRVCLAKVVQAILYRLKTGCQWRELPLRQFLALEADNKYHVYFSNQG
jgi:transposase